MSKNCNKNQVNQRQRLAALLISSGVTNKQAAEIVGVAGETISRWKKQEAFKELLTQRMAEAEDELTKARDILIEAAVLAALRTFNTLDSEDEAVALRAAGDILDRVGIAKTTKIEQTTDSHIRLEWDDGDENDNAATPPPGATDDSPEQGQVQSGGGGQEIREDQAGSD